MPVYTYRCRKCGVLFDKLFLSFDQEKLKTAECPECHATATRDYSTHRFSMAGSGPYAGELAEDSEEYREMHYYEKQKNWEKAAQAAEGVSDYAKNKFLQKAQQDDSDPG